MFGITCQEFLNNYEIGSYLGNGSTCVVLEARKKSEDTFYAVKVLDKYESTINVARIDEEIHILSKINHHNIIKLHETFRNEDNVLMVFEKVDSQDLFDKIQTRDGYPEEEAVGLVRQLVDAIWYLHRNDIVHRDIKPENILVLTQNGKEIIKLADFGFARTMSHPEEKMTRLVGTYEYFSPEQILRKPYDKSVDMWAFGITCFVIFSARRLFYDEDEEKSRQKAVVGDIKLVDLLVCSDEAKDFMRRLLTVDPAQRMTSEQARAHPWLSMRVPITPLRPTVASPLMKRTTPVHFHRTPKGAIAEGRAREEEEYGSEMSSIVIPDNLHSPSLHSPFKSVINNMSNMTISSSKIPKKLF